MKSRPHSRHARASSGCMMPFKPNGTLISERRKRTYSQVITDRYAGSFPGLTGRGPVTWPSFALCSAIAAQAELAGRDTGDIRVHRWIHPAREDRLELT